MSEENEPGDEWPTCGLCEQPMRGWAQINDVWLCHPDEGPSCYMRYNAEMVAGADREAKE